MHTQSLSNSSQAKLDRTTFQTSRMLEFCSEKELVAQTGHNTNAWPLVVLKELVDNALDACEEAGTDPEITIAVDTDGASPSPTMDPASRPTPSTACWTIRSGYRTGRHTLRQIGVPRETP